MSTDDLKGFRTNQVSEIVAAASAIGVQRLAFYHSTRHHAILHPKILPDAMPSCILPYYQTPCGLVSYHSTRRRAILYPIIPTDAVPSCIRSYYQTPYHLVSNHTTRTVPSCILPYHQTPCHLVSYHTTRRHAVLYPTIVRDAVPSCFRSFFQTP